MIVCLLVFSSPLFAVEDAAALLKELNEKYLAADDIEIAFFHETVFADFDETSSGNGNLYIKRPGRMRWNYLKPSRQEIYIDNNTVTLYSPALEQVIISDMSERASSLVPLRLLLGKATLNDEFEVEVLSKGTSRLFTLTPKQHTLDEIEKIELTAEGVLIKSILMYLKNGNMTGLYFSDFKWNKGISDQVFEFIPEPGLEIIDQRKQ